MTKEEFLKAADEGFVHDSDYATIEFVYTWHPSISSDNGKVQIARIYNLNGGMRIINDMVATAQKAKEIEDKLFSLRSQVDDLQKQLNAL